MSDAPRELAARMIQAFDTPQAAEGLTERIVDPVSGDIVARLAAGESPSSSMDGQLDMEELDLSLVAFASDQAIDAVAFMGWADADRNHTLNLDELETLIACMDDIERRSLAIKLTRVESTREAFAAARPATTVGKWLAKAGFQSKLMERDAEYQAARVDFVGHLMAYAGAGR